MKWQPIETAPRDGTAILVIKAGEWKPGFPFEPVVASWVNDWKQRGYEGPWELDEEIYYDEDTWRPTHWMPLPEPPTD